MRCRVLFFAGLREVAQAESADLEFASESVSVGDLRAELNRRWPALASQRFALAVEAAYAQDDEAVPANAEVALIPPVSGG